MSVTPDGITDYSRHSATPNGVADIRNPIHTRPLTTPNGVADIGPRNVLPPRLFPTG